MRTGVRGRSAAMLLVVLFAAPMAACPFDPEVSVGSRDGGRDRPQASWDGRAEAGLRDGGPDAADARVDAAPDGGGRCVGTCLACGQRDQGTCGQGDGCSWTDPGCTGQCTGCDAFTQADPCNHQQGCHWWEDWACRGTCRPCGDYHDATLCAGQDGCTWQEASCSGSPTQCDELSVSQCTQQPGCQVSGGCIGACSLDTEQRTCQNAGCDFRCPQGVCSCTGFCSPNASPSACTAAGCTWTGGSCSGTAQACGGETEEDCPLGCDWNPAACTGNCTICPHRDTQDACQAQDGCQWRVVVSECRGTCDACGSLDQEACEAQTGCSWNPGGCRGTCTPCSSFTDAASCRAQPGCSWQEP